jgi:histidine triad (HIT) family protein
MSVLIRPMTDEDRESRHEIDRRCAALIEQGVCPSCQQFRSGDVFPGQRAQQYYEDDLVSLHLESYPRGMGHTIILSKEHYADIAEMPVALGCHIARITHVAANALKAVVEAEKVYQVTMCSGALSHLHFQLIPRRNGEMIGGRVFASPRGVLADYEATRAALEAEMRRRMQ